MQPPTVCPVADLIVILYADDELARDERRWISAARMTHVLGILAGEKPAVLQCPGEINGGAAEIGVVPLVIVRGMDPRLMVEIICPDTIHPVAADFGRLQECREIAVVLGDEEQRSPRMRADGRRELRQEMLLAVVHEGMRRIQ